jgi:transposase
MAFAPITRLLRVGWHTIGPIVERVVADHLDERRLAGLVCIGVDEISYRRHHRYLTTVADHATGAILWCQPGRNSATLAAFFSELGDAKASIRAVSVDMSGEYQRAIRAAVPNAEICFDPFHVVRLAARATDQVRRDEWNEHDRSHTPHGRWVKSTRWPLLKAPEHQTSASSPPCTRSARPTSASTAPSCCAKNCACSTTCPTATWRPHISMPGWPGPPAHDCGRSCASARTLREHRDGILAAIRHGLSNGRLEGLNSKIRLLSHRAFGFHSADPLIALVYLCCAGVTITLPR